MSGAHAQSSCWRVSTLDAQTSLASVSRGAKTFRRRRTHHIARIEVEWCGGDARYGILVACTPNGCARESLISFRVFDSWTDLSDTLHYPEQMLPVYVCCAGAAAYLRSSVVVRHGAYCAQRRHTTKATAIIYLNGRTGGKNCAFDSAKLGVVCLM